MSKAASKYLDSGATARWLRYASAGGVALASAGAEGEIVLMKNLPAHLTEAGSNMIDLDDDGKMDIQLFWSSYTYSIVGMQMHNNAHPPTGVLICNVGKGEEIPPSPIDPAAKCNGNAVANTAASSSGIYSFASNSLTIGTGFKGIRLETGKIGWINIELTGDPDKYIHTRLSILKGAYENTGGGDSGWRGARAIQFRLSRFAGGRSWRRPCAEEVPKAPTDRRG